MPIDAKLLEILVCPECKKPVVTEPIVGEQARMIVDRYRDKFKGEEPVVSDGLRCDGCRRLYPIVSEIPVMLIDEAIPGPSGPSSRR